MRKLLKLKKNQSRTAFKNDMRRKQHSLTNVRLLLAMRKLGLTGKVTHRILPRVLERNLSWQQKIKWCDKIVTYSGPKTSSSLEYQRVICYSEEEAQAAYQPYRDRMTGKNNIAADHGGRLSPWSKKSGRSDIQITASIQKSKDSLKKNGTRNTDVRLYLKKGLGLCQAISALKERQAVGRLSKFVERYGEEGGKVRWEKRQEKWLNNCKKANFSAASQKLFDGIIEEGYTGNVYYATFDRENMDGYVNKELRLKIGGKTILPDFIDIDTKKIIEFDGLYWHRRNPVNATREKIRDRLIRDSGYEVYHVCEGDFKKDPEGTVEKCLNYLTQSKENS